MSAIHEYDYNMWRGELNNLNEAKQILRNTEIDSSVMLAIDAAITELKGFLQYGADPNGPGPDYPNKNRI
jgi:hypothetical protein